MTQIPIYVLWFQKEPNDALETWIDKHSHSYNHPFIFLMDNKSFNHIYFKLDLEEYFERDDEGDVYALYINKASIPQRIFVYDNELASGIGFKRQKALLHGRQYPHFAMMDQNVNSLRLMREGDHFDCERGESRSIHDFIEVAISNMLPHTMMMCPTVMGSQGTYKGERTRFNETIAADKFYVFQSRAIPFGAHYDIELARFGEDRDFYLRYYHNGNIIKDKQYVMCIQEGTSTKMTEGQLAEFHIDPYVRLIERHKNKIVVSIGVQREMLLEEYIETMKESICYEKTGKIPIPGSAAFIIQKEAGSDVKLKSEIFKVELKSTVYSDGEGDREGRRSRRGVKIICYGDPKIKGTNLKYTQLWTKAFEAYFELINDKYYDY